MKKLFISILLIFGITHANAVTHKHHSKHAKITHHKSKPAAPKTNYMYGIASYYGGTDGFDGRKMANGDIFRSTNPNLSAHPTLPLGTKLKVTDIATHRSIYVEVTDRMPKRGKVIDLSKGGARALGIRGRGIAKVQLSIISNDEYEDKKLTVEVDDGDPGTPD